MENVTVVVARHEDSRNSIWGSSVYSQHRLSENEPRLSTRYATASTHTLAFSPENSRQNEDAQSVLAALKVARSAICKDTASEFCVKSFARLRTECRVLVLLSGHLQ